MNNDATKSLMRLARYLEEKTVEGLVTWRQDDTQNRYRYDGASSSVWIEGRTDESGGFIGSLTLLSPSGAVVDRLDSPSAGSGSSMAPAEAGSTTGTLIERLYGLARRTALQVDRLVEQTIQELDRKSMS